MKKLLAVLLICTLIAPYLGAIKVKAEESSGLEITASSAILMEGSTGEIIYEKNKEEELPPASITKIMTLLLIFEALNEKKITLADTVTVSEHAASMGGSQVYLEPYETQDVNTMIKCIAISSANDAAVAMAELIAGSEEEFVKRMNERAKELGMNHTNFKNCTGLDIDGHYSSAIDVALMSRELITKHPEISKYSTVWMDEFKHVTKKGESVFGLSNTNKLVRTYKGITGLKTGSTGKAKYCLSATANREGMDLIAVVMSAPDHKIRFTEAAKLLDYGFANCSLYVDDYKDTTFEMLPVKSGKSNEVATHAKQPFKYTCLSDKNPADITKEITYSQDVKAPIKQGDEVGTITYYWNKEKIGSVPIVCANDVERATFKDNFYRITKQYFMGKNKKK